jgi:dCTP deaminase
MLLSDKEIRKRARKGMIEPFAEGDKRPGVISYGLSSYGYDMRLGHKFLVTRPYDLQRLASPIDPKRIDPELFREQTVDEGCYFVLRSGDFALAESLETFDIPRDVLCQVFGKSTYARSGVLVMVTPLEPEWRGKVTIELANVTPRPVTVYPGEGIAQILFCKGTEPCSRSYADKAGKYQNQMTVTTPKVD